MTKIVSFFRFNKPLFLRSFKLSTPIMLGSLGIVLMGVCDVLMLGKYSTSHQGSAAVSNGLFFLVVVFGMGVIFGLSALISNAIGEKKHFVVFAIFKKGLIASVLLAAACMIILFLVADNFWILQQQESIQVQGVAYLKMATWSVLPMFVFVAARQLTDGVGITKPAMYVTLLALPLNIIGNYFLIFGEFGFPELGAEGAAISSLVVRCIMAVALIVYIYSSKRFKLYRQDAKATKVTLYAIFAIGIPIGLQFLYEVGLFAIAKIFAGMLGEVQLAAHEIALSLASITFMVAGGLSAGGAIMVGNANGANNPFKMKRVASIHYTMILMFMIFCAGLFLIFNNSFAQLFSIDPEVIKLAAQLLIFVSAFQVFDGVATVSMGLLRGAKDVKYPSNVALIMYVVFGITSCYLLAFHTTLGLHGLWLGLTVSLMGSSVLLIKRYYKVIKTKKEVLFLGKV